MEYNPQSDIYTCKNGKHLTVDCIKSSKSKTGYVSQKTIYRCEDCTGCVYKSECIKGNNCKTPLEVRTEALSSNTPTAYPIPRNKRIEKYKEKWVA